MCAGYDAATQRLTFISGVLLVEGIMSLAPFAFLNAPFKSAEAISDTPGDAPHTVVVPVTETKGFEHLPEPVRRPQSPTPSKEPRRKKNAEK